MSIQTRNNHTPVRGERFNVRSVAKGYNLGDEMEIVDELGRKIAVAVCVKRCGDDPKYFQQPYSDPRRAVPLPPKNFGEHIYTFEVQ